jgi:hypothetical protein
MRYTASPFKMPPSLPPKSRAYRTAVQNNPFPLLPLPRLDIALPFKVQNSLSPSPPSVLPCKLQSAHSWQLDFLVLQISALHLTNGCPLSYEF